MRSNGNHLINQSGVSIRHTMAKADSATICSIGFCYAMNREIDGEIGLDIRGAPVVNDLIAENAAYVGIDDYATVISHGDDSLGTVLPRTSIALIYCAADIIVKGLANYKSLSDQDYCHRKG